MKTKHKPSKNCFYCPYRSSRLCDKFDTTKNFPPCEDCPYDYKCLKAVSVDAVFEVAKKILEKRS